MLVRTIALSKYVPVITTESKKKQGADNSNLGGEDEMYQVRWLLSVDANVVG